MTAVLLDTHAWAWSFAAPERLSAPARSAIEEADAAYVSPISFFEISQKIRLGKWPDLAPYAASLPSLVQTHGGEVAPFTPEICLHAGQRIWQHRDPFDRLLASSAEVLGIALISKDPVFRSLRSIHCIW